MKCLILRRRTLTVLACALLAAAMFALVNAPAVAEASATDRQLPIYCVQRDQKMLAISFDAAWGNEDTQQLIDILGEYQIKATFFVVGDWVDKYPESVKALHDAGHEVMNHSNSHAHMSQLSSEAIVADVEACNDKIEAITGVRPTLIRCPYGEYDDHVISAIRSIGMEPIQWDVDSLDWKEIPANEITQRVVSRVCPGSIVLFHNAAIHTPEALPGYRPARPMVFCGIYTEDGSKYPDLRDALEKLQLNDASLSFEPESSAALGFGFRCGFLGMLHMEIIQERLEREFDLDLITTLPSVIYRITKTDGTVVMVDNPHNYPDPAVIELAEEPYAKVSIVSPPDYVGNIMPMCQERRGEFKDMQYLDTNLVELHYSMPLGEIIYDFFDTLKARTKGYASLDYELNKYEPSELVKVDMLLNGDQVDALSFIAHREKAYPRARRLCEKLRDNIPRQLFEVPVQAAIGGKVIARETVKAMRKDVLAKCYGGDISRKKKLLEKQKEGKKKMRQLGSVSLPSEAFTAVLKLDSTDD
mgnify:CR=1 FL=1